MSCNSEAIMVSPCVCVCFCLFMWFYRCLSGEPNGRLAPHRYYFTGLEVYLWVMSYALVTPSMTITRSRNLLNLEIAIPWSVFIVEHGKTYSHNVRHLSRTLMFRFQFQRSTGVENRNRCRNFKSLLICLMIIETNVDLLAMIIIPW